MPNVGAPDFLKNSCRYAWPVILDLDKGQALPRLDPLENFREQRNARACVTFARAEAMAAIEPRPRIEAAQNTCPMFPHPTATRRRAVQAGVVNDHRNAVRGELNVEFNSAHPLTPGQLVRRHGILRSFARRATMTDLEGRPNQRLGAAVEHTLQNGGEGRHVGFRRNDFGRYPDRKSRKRLFKRLA